MPKVSSFKWSNQIRDNSRVHFLKKTVGYKWVKLLKLGSFERFELNMPSDRVFSVLSENQTPVEIGLTENKLWPVKDSLHTCMTFLPSLQAKLASVPIYPSLVVGILFIGGIVGCFTISVNSHFVFATWF